MIQDELALLPIVAHGERGVLVRRGEEIVVKVVFEKKDFPSAQYGKDIEVEVAALAHAEQLGLPVPHVYSSGKPETSMTYGFKGKSRPILGWIEMSEIRGERAGDVLERDPSVAPRYSESLARALHKLHVSTPSVELQAVIKGSPLPHLMEKAELFLTTRNDENLFAAYERVRKVIEDILKLPATATIHSDIHDWNVLADEHGEVTGIVDWSMTARAHPLHEFYDYESESDVESLLIKEYKKLSSLSFNPRDLVALHALKAASLGTDFPEKQEKFVNKFKLFAALI